MKYSNSDYLLYPYAGKLAHTYSIVARDPETGEMGVAVQSHWFSVGRLVMWAEAGVGAIATQSFVNCMLGQKGLELLRKGGTAQDVLQDVIKADEGRDVRQLAIVDANGVVSAWTGKGCIPEAGHIIGDNFSVQANLMLNNRVWPAMAEAFQQAKGSLAERMVTALEAAQKAGGDIRGKQSAAILVVRKESTGKSWEDHLVDLRIEDHPAPVQELRRLLKLSEAYQHMNAGDLAIERNDIDQALREYRTAEGMFPKNLEMKFWHAFSLVNVGRIEESLPIFTKVFKQDQNWKILIKRLKAMGMLKVSDEHLQSILSV